MDDIAKIICQTSNILFNNNMINIYDLYVIATVDLIQLIKIHCYRKNSQHYMSAHPNFKNISIDNHKQEKLFTFMLTYGVYIIG